MAERLADWAAWLAANPFTKGLAVLISVTAWLFVQQDVAREAVVPVRVQWGVPDGLVPTEPLRNQISLRVEGPRLAINRARAAGLDQRVDLTGMPIGEHVVDLAGLDWSVVPSSLRLVAVEPPSLTVDLDELDQQKVRVETRQIGEPGASWGVRDVEIEPRVVEVEGPHRVVSRMDRVFTKPIDVSGMTGRTELDAPLDLPRGVEVVGGGVPRATVDVVVVTRTLEHLTVPVLVYDDYGYVPEPTQLQVSLRGPAPTLDWLGDTSVVAFVRLPPDAPSSVVARYGSQRGPRIEIWHQGGPEVVVTSVDPSEVRLERR